MLKQNWIALACVVALCAFGCAPAETTSNEPSTAPPSSTPAGEPTATSGTEEMAKCPGCGKEVKKSDMSMHDGQMLCKDCIASHGH